MSLSLGAWKTQNRSKEEAGFMEQVEIWGVRGSLPMTGSEYQGYGGSTCCVSVDCGDKLVVFDAGTGIVRLGLEIAEQKKPVHLFLTHLHVDHVLGLYGFQPLYKPGQELHIYGPCVEEGSLQKVLSGLVGAPYWPIPLGKMAADITLHEIKEQETILLPGETSVKTCRSNHPGVCLMYRMEHQGKALVYGMDCEVDERMSQSYRSFAKKAQLILFDAHFLPEDLAGHVGWGHSSWVEGIRIKEEAQASKVAMMHYSWEYEDAVIDRANESAKKQDADCIFAREGMRITL